MRAWIEEDPSVVTVHVAGELDALTVAQLMPVMNELRQKSQRHWVFDFGALRMLDSSGIKAILALRRDAQQRRGTLEIVAASGQPLSVLRLLGLDRACDVVANAHAAAA
jgi:stage II sporulation protein AA (anti-sigma F factor antagonist)